jgi:rRNA maturation endonuclease Nob1
MRKFKVEVQSNSMVMYMCSVCFSVMIVPKNYRLDKCEVCGSNKIHKVKMLD